MSDLEGGWGIAYRGLPGVLERKPYSCQAIGSFRFSAGAEWTS